MSKVGAAQTKSFYRTYRPQTFDQVVGQDFIVKTLRHQIAHGPVGHAYLFCGTRGTGKTTVAKIFARAVNCEHHVDGQPCGTCAWCQNPNQELDIFEIDAASNNGVDAVRELVESVQYPPVVGRYKVYIIDEVHMFSGAAFNALLKTLEEPPAHVIFILATTEPQKLLPTVQSRCLRFNFQNVALSDIARVVAGVFQHEKITASAAVIEQIAKEGRGSVRDALSFADTVAAYCGKKNITAHDLTQVLGGVDPATYAQLVTQIQSGAAAACRETVSQIFQASAGTDRIMNGILTALKDALVATGPTAATPTVREKLAHALQIFAELEQNIKYATDPQAYFETATLVACGA